MVKERFQRYKDVGIDSLGIRIDGDLTARSETLEQVMDLINAVG
jgi:hypothetical protein